MTITKLDLLTRIAARAREYSPDAVDSVNRNAHMNETKAECTTPQADVDAILVGFVNYCGQAEGVDYAMYTKDLRDEFDQAMLIERSQTSSPE